MMQFFQVQGQGAV